MSLKTLIAGMSQDGGGGGGGPSGGASYVPAGGLTNEILAKSSAADGATAWTTHVPAGASYVTFAGPTAARVVTLPDAAFSVARTDAAQTFGGTQTFGTANVTILNVPDGLASAVSVAVGEYRTGLWGRAGGATLDIATQGTKMIEFDGVTPQMRMLSNMQFGWAAGAPDGGLADTILLRDAANTLALRNGTADQEFRVYGLYTDDSNKHYGSAKMTDTGLEISTQTAGTGVDNLDIALVPSGTGRVYVSSGAVYGSTSGAASSTATPLNVSFGNTFGSSAPGSASNLKWDMLTATSNRYGIGMSAGFMEYQGGVTGGHSFYVDQGTLALSIGGGYLSTKGQVSIPGTLSVTGLMTLGSPVRLKNYTVATLPAGTQGDTAFVTDALAPTFLATIVGGGTVVTPVFYNGTNWVGY